MLRCLDNDVVDDDGGEEEEEEEKELRMLSAVMSDAALRVTGEYLSRIS